MEANQDTTIFRFFFYFIILIFHSAQAASKTPMEYPPNNFTLTNKFISKNSSVKFIVELRTLLVCLLFDNILCLKLEHSCL